MAALDGLSVSVVMHCGDGCEIVVPKRQFIFVYNVLNDRQDSPVRFSLIFHMFCIIISLIRKIVCFENWHKFPRNFILLLEG